MKAAVLACLVLTGCGYMTERQATDPRGQIIGSNIADVLPCAGYPEKLQKILPDVAMGQWTYKDTSPAFKLSLSVIGSVQIGTAGSCSMTISFLQDGLIVDTSFPQCAGTFEGGPYAAARPLISECLRHPNDQSKPDGYDAFAVLGVETKPHP